MVPYHHIITLEPGKRGGKPTICHLRITVQDVLEWLAEGMTVEQIIYDFPELSKEDILACLAYAADQEKSHYGLTSISEKGVIEPVRLKEYDLSQLLAGITAENLHAEVDFGPAVGEDNK